MRKTLTLLSFVTVTNAFALEQKDLMPLIENASTNKGRAYLEARDKIVEYGSDVIPILAEIAVDGTLPWQQRLATRIAYERIERIKDIKKIIETDWYAHPKFDKEWNMLLPGPEGRMHDMVESDLKETGLWYYYLEVEWKMTNERAEIRRGNPDRWESWCIFAVKDNPEERVWFLRICADLMAMTPPPPSWLDKYYSRTRKVGGGFSIIPSSKS